MLLINKSARLITFNVIIAKKRESYEFMPAAKDGTEVPEAAASNPYIMALRDNGDLDVVGEEDPTDALRKEAESLGIDIDKRWGDERLKEEIAKAQG